MKWVDEEYSRRIADGAVLDDDHQRSAIVMLDTLLDALHHQKKNPLMGGLLSFFFNIGSKSPPPKGVYLVGGVGRGKSMLMDIFADCARQNGIKTCRFHFHDFMIAVHDKVHDPKLASMPDPARHVAAAITGGAKLICFDEMEVRDIADAMIVARVMQGFFEDGGVMVSTSNRMPDDLYEKGLHRERFLPFIALLKEKMIIHNIDSDIDWRQRVLSGMTAWYSPNDTMSKSSMQMAFEKLSGGAAVAAVTVTVKARDIVLGHASGSIAAIGFDELCARPLAARDYIALADRFAGLLVHDIPKLDDETRNEARRFMWLVDAFYDRGRFLVCSAETALADVYSGTAWQAEFPRTVSRLTEMTKI